MATDFRTLRRWRQWQTQHTHELFRMRRKTETPIIRELIDYVGCLEEVVGNLIDEIIDLRKHTELRRDAPPPPAPPLTRR